MFQFLFNLIGKKVSSDIGLTEGQVETKKWYLSKSIWTAVITAILGIVQAVSTSTGKPIVIPEYVYAILGSLGLYSLRTGDKPIA